MLIATSVDGEKKTLFLGFTNEDINVLKSDYPIYKDLQEEDVSGMEEWDLYILGPSDTIRFIAQVKPEETDAA